MVGCRRRLWPEMRDGFGPRRSDDRDRPHTRCPWPETLYFGLHFQRDRGLCSAKSEAATVVASWRCLLGGVYEYCLAAGNCAHGLSLRGCGCGECACFVQDFDSEPCCRIQCAAQFKGTPSRMGFHDSYAIPFVLCAHHHSVFYQNKLHLRFVLREPQSNLLLGKNADEAAIVFLPAHLLQGSGECFPNRQPSGAGDTFSGLQFFSARSSLTLAFARFFFCEELRSSLLNHLSSIHLPAASITPNRQLIASS